MGSEEDSPVMKTVKGAVMGLASGTILGTFVATWHNVSRVERHVALPALIRTLKMCGSYGVTFAALGGLQHGVEQLVQRQRKKRDYVNGAIGAFVAGAAYGYRVNNYDPVHWLARLISVKSGNAQLAGRSIQSAIITGSGLAFINTALYNCRNTTKVDNGKEYYAYTTEKKPAH